MSKEEYEAAFNAGVEMGSLQTEHAILELLVLMGGLATKIESNDAECARKLAATLAVSDLDSLLCEVRSMHRAMKKEVTGEQSAP